MTLEQLAIDTTRVINHVMRDEERQYGIYATDKRNAQLIVRVAKTRFGNRQELATVIAWVFRITAWSARFQPLTDEELLVHAAAERVSALITMLDTVEQLGHAIEAQAWHEARQLWQQLAPFHAFIISGNPEVDALNVILHDRHALAKSASKRVH